MSWAFQRRRLQCFHGCRSSDETSNKDLEVRAKVFEGRECLMTDGILSGLRVLDFTWVLAGPYATRILADFSAEVIKVQSLKTAKGAELNLSGYFSTWNRNKRSITLDMSHPEAGELILNLARISDVVIENFAPRVMANWGLTYEKWKEANPQIIMVSMSAMGQTGPWKDHVAFGPALQALSGLTYLSSFDDEQPLGLGYAYGDHVIGLYGAPCRSGSPGEQVQDRLRTAYRSLRV